MKINADKTEIIFLEEVVSSETVRNGSIEVYTLKTSLSGFVFCPKIFLESCTKHTQQAENVILNVKDSMFLFDSMIFPILCYGSKVRGFEDVYVIESVHLKFADISYKLTLAHVKLLFMVNWVDIRFT